MNILEARQRGENGSINRCKSCSGIDCCGILCEGGEIEPPFLSSYDIEKIEYFSGLKKEQFAEERINPITSHTIHLMKTSPHKGCIFFNNRTGLCDIYAFRPIDCRLFPLDIRFVQGRYLWALFKYSRCGSGIEQDLSQLMQYRTEALEILRMDIHDYSTFPVPGMERIGYKLLDEIKLS
jgi:Fe-S-cluster containining protein